MFCGSFLLYAQTPSIEIDTTSQCGGSLCTGDTAVSTAADGHVTVSVNTQLMDNDVSHNYYRRFNVPEAGVTLDNGAAFARTIINEVTGGDPSLLKGRMDMIGRRANVVIANPNGISVNGARFDDMGSVALTTGVISYDQLRQEHKATVSAGQILIEEGGLAGSLAHLELLAKEIVLDGAVTNENADPEALVKLGAGAGEHVFNTNLLAGDASVDFTVQSGAGAASNAILLNITRRASVAGGRIEIAVTDTGGGVRNMGELAAGAGHFVLTSSGHVQMTGGQATAKAETVIRAGSLTLASDDTDAEGRSYTVPEQSQLLSEDSGVYINVTGDIANEGGSIEGKTRIPDAPWDAVSQGAVTMIAEGELHNSSRLNEPMAVVFGVEDDVVLQAGGAIENYASRIISNASLRLISDTRVRNYVIWQGPPDAGTVHKSRREKSGKLWHFFKDRVIKKSMIDYGDFAIPDQLAYLVGQSGVIIDAPEVFNHGGEINADNGDISIAADIFDNEAYRTGQVAWWRSCRWWCDENARSTGQIRGGLVNAGNDLTVTLTGALTNHGGRLFAINDLEIDAAKVTGEAKELITSWQQPAGWGKLTDRHYSFIRRQDQGGSFIANMGMLRFGVAEPVVLTGGSAEAGGAIDSSQPVDQQRDPVNETDFRHRSIGLWDWLF